MKKQTIVLNEINLGKQTKYTINEIVEMSELTKQQVYNALADLKNRRLIIKEHNFIKSKKGEILQKKVYIRLNTEKSVEDRIKKILEREKNG